ncbi:hypothetical protein F7U66_00450 [Vibrio parahaemolyticus]|nr:hypothetical protein [Vibrio parahaemolyticus]
MAYDQLISIIDKLNHREWWEYAAITIPPTISLIVVYVSLRNCNRLLNGHSGTEILRKIQEYNHAMDSLRIYHSTHVVFMTKIENTLSELLNGRHSDAELNWDFYNSTAHRNAKAEMLIGLNSLKNANDFELYVKVRQHMSNQDSLINDICSMNINPQSKEPSQILLGNKDTDSIREKANKLADECDSCIIKITERIQALMKEKT